MKKTKTVAFYLFALLALTLVALSATTFAVRLTSDADGDSRPPVPPPPPPPIPPVPPRPMPVEPALVSLIDRVTIDGPYSSTSGLTVYLLSTREPESRPTFLTLDEGVSTGQIVVQEFGGGRVDTLQVRNTSSRWAFLMAGEVLSGGKQNRTVREDTLLPPGGVAWFAVPVFCVEQHRWTGTEKFEGAKAAAPNSVRSGMSQGYGQAEVWRDVESVQKAKGVRSETGDVTALYRDEKTARAINDITGEICKRLPRRAYIGLVVAHNRRIVSADLFADSSLYAALYEKIIRSHAAEVCFVKPEPGTNTWPTVEEVRGFLRGARWASFSRRPASFGYGEIITISGSGVAGRALEYDGRCIHAAVFQAITVPVPLPRRDPGRGAE
jgi:hypothetical protein